MLRWVLRRALLLSDAVRSGGESRSAPSRAEWGRRLAELRPALLRLVRSKVGNEADVQEIASESIARAFAHRDYLRNPDRLRAWLFRIARNQIVDYYRSARETVALSQETPAPAAEDERTTLASLANCLGSLTGKLPESYARAVEMADLEGLSQREVAEATGLSLSGAKSRIQRGRRLLAKKIEDCCHIEFDTLGNPVDHWPRGRCAHC